MDKRQTDIRYFFDKEMPSAYSDKKRFRDMKLAVTEKKASKKRKIAVSDRSNDYPASHVTQDVASSVANAVATGAVRRLGLNMSGQASEAVSMDIDQSQGTTSDRPNQLGMREKELEPSSKKLETSESEESRCEKILQRVEHFKQEAQNIAEICRESRVKGKSILLEEFCSECDRYEKEYETSYNAVKNSGSSNQDSIIKDLRQYQHAVLLLSRFSINNLEESQRKYNHIGKQEKFDKQMAKCKQFVKQISDLNNLTSEQKQQMLEKYHGMLQKCKDKLKELQEEISKKEVSHLRELAKSVNYIKRDMVALGKIIESDYLQRDANLPHLGAIQKGTEKYKQTLREYNLCKEDAKKFQFDKKNELELAWQRLGEMFKCVEELQKEYIALTESDNKEWSKDKGKEHVADGPMTDLVDDSGETIAGIKRLESAEDRMKRIQGIYKSGMQNIAQGKLEICLHDPAYLSDKEIRYVGCKLSQQLMDVCGMLLQPADQDQRANLKKIDDDNQIAEMYRFFKDEKSFITKENVNKLFTLMKRYQKAIDKQITGKFDKPEYNKEIGSFKQQIKQYLELGKPGKNIEAYKADIRAKELGYLFFRKIKNDVTLAHTTFAVAYMRDPQTEKILSFVSVNEGASDARIQKFGQKYTKENPTITWLPSKGKGIEGRHAEHVLIDYAEAQGLKIVGIGASRPFCGNCCKLLEEKVEQQARGQILSGGSVGERSSTHWRGSRVGAREGGTADLRGVKWDSESDSESSHRQMNVSNDEEAQKISQAGRIESSWDGARRLGDSNTEKAASDKNDLEVIEAQDKKERKRQNERKRRRELKNNADKGDEKAIEALKEKNEQSMQYNRELKENANKGDPAAIAVLNKRKEQKRQSRQKLKENANKLDPAAIEARKKIKEQKRQSRKGRRRKLKENADKGDPAAIEARKKIKEQKSQYDKGRRQKLKENAIEGNNKQ
jgi:hypothetical protein